MFISRRRLLHGMGAYGLVNTALSRLSAQISHKDMAAVAKPDSGPIRLHNNENCYGPSPLATAAARESVDNANRYPHTAEILQQKIAALHKVKPEQVVLGCGSSEILRMLADTFLPKGKKLVIASPSFPLLQIYAMARRAEIATVPLTREYTHDLKAMLAAAGPSTGLIHICNPNNPTGTLTPREDLERFLRAVPSGIPVVIDEAYHHYVNGPAPYYASFIDRPAENKNVIVVRTFSKIYGLAGLRLGYAVADPVLAQQFSSSRLQFAVSTIAIPAAMAALDDTGHVSTSAMRNNSERQEFFNKAILRKVRVIDSHANFMLLKAGLPAEQIITHFRENNILLAPPIPAMEKYVRVSMGKTEEMNEFWRVFDLLPLTAWSCRAISALV